MVKSSFWRCFFFSCCCLFVTGGWCQTRATVTVKGYVYLDKNNNGARDPNEAGVKGVGVSDQATVVMTNADGSYTLQTADHLGSVYVIQPEGYVVKGLFWRSMPEQQNDVVFDFPLYAQPNTGSFTFLHASDPHVSEQSLPRLERLKAMVDSLKPAFVLMTGDLIKDALRVPESEATRLYELYVKTIQKFSVPVWNVPGNHEIFGIERHKSLVSDKHPLYGKKMYRHYLGPDYYAFQYGGIRFVGLNSVDYHDLWYYGHIDSLQLTWLAKEVSTIAKTTPIITFNHIPFYSGGMSMMEYTDEEPGSVLITIEGKKHWRHVVTNADAVIKIFEGYTFPVALSGHYHAAQKFTLDGASPKTEFHQTGAVVGPSAEGAFNMPSGVILYTVVNGLIKDRKFIPIR